MLVASSARLSNVDFFLARAEQARVDAEVATLDHVRQRCRRSEEAWTALAVGVQRAEQFKILEQERKAAQPPA